MTDALPRRSKTKAEWDEIVSKVKHTGKMANTLAKALGKRYAHRWQFIDFLGPSGRESAGIVDIQVKGGSARLPNADEIRRLRIVQECYQADRVVLFEWRKGETAKFSTLEADGEWHESSASILFGRKS